MNARRAPGGSRSPCGGSDPGAGPRRADVPGGARGDHGGRFGDRQGLGPVAPHGAQRDPEQAVSWSKSWAASAIGERAELMAQGEVFENEGPSRAGQSLDRPDEKLQEEQHRRKMCADRGDCNRLRLTSRSKAGRMEFWRSTAFSATDPGTRSVRAALSSRSVVQETRPRGQPPLASQNVMRSDRFTTAAMDACRLY